MYVLVTHDIIDPQGFALAEDRASADIDLGGWPEGIGGCPISLHDLERKIEVCLFEADSVEAVRAFVEPILGPQLSENNYFQIAPETVPVLAGAVLERA